MFESDPVKSLRSVTKDMGATEFLIRQVVHEDIWYFSYGMWKSQSLLKAKKGRVWGKTKLQSFSTNSVITDLRTCFDFSQTRKILSRSNGKHKEQPITCSIPTRCTNIDENQTTTSNHAVWGGYWWHWCYATNLLFTWPQTQHKGLYQVTTGGSFSLDREGGSWNIFRLVKRYCKMSHRQENLMLTVRKLHPEYLVT